MKKILLAGLAGRTLGAAKELVRSGEITNVAPATVAGAAAAELRQSSIFENATTARRERVKLVAVNALVFFVLFNLVYWMLPVVEFVKSSMRHDRVMVDPRSQLPNYQSITWAVQHYREFGQLKTAFKSFVGWRREPFDGETIKVIGPYGQRRTINQFSGPATVYFFGGSTMWGTGSNDESTIPSQFAALTATHSENFGETAYTAHQSLMLLIQLLQEGHRPDLVVFYDGVNDVAHKCLKEVPADAHSLEARIAKLLKEERPRVRSFSHYIAPLMSLGVRIKDNVGGRPSEADFFECQVNPKKAASIANNLISDWQLAKRISESFGAKFIGILQPVLYFSRTNHDHVQINPNMQAQFRVVYPLIQERLAGHPDLYDFTSAVDIPDFIYVDFCHVSPNGNRLIAQRIAGIASSLEIAH